MVVVVVAAWPMSDKRKCTADILIVKPCVCRTAGGMAAVRPGCVCVCVYRCLCVGETGVRVASTFSTPNTPKLS